MVKQAMKRLRTGDGLGRTGRTGLLDALDARQLALKLVANVTYGYTSASFSGRMPCVDLADSIVEMGRRTLEATIRLVEDTVEWGAEVVYGDTDSIFVHLPGRTRAESFRIGREIASRVTAMNPSPVMLQFEKVYHPCVLISKKRYVGYKYESEAQCSPVFDAKGIETVRRDSCPAVQKIMEKTIRHLFEIPNLSQLRSYLVGQFQRILTDRVSLQDFVFAKEVRIGSYRALPPPAALVAMKAMSEDPRAEPPHGARVPFVVVAGSSKSRLADLVMSPLEYVRAKKPKRLNAIYYIEKQIIPCLSRILNLVGVDLTEWYREMPKDLKLTMKQRAHMLDLSSRKVRSTIDQYYAVATCLCCEKVCKPGDPLCIGCKRNPQTIILRLMRLTSELGEEHHQLSTICSQCMGETGWVRASHLCTSLDCPVFYSRAKNTRTLRAMETVSSREDMFLAPPSPS